MSINNKNTGASIKSKNFNLRIIKIGKKGENDPNAYFSILLKLY